MKLIIVAFAALASAAQVVPAIRPGTITTGDVALATAGIPRFTADRYPALPPSVREALTTINCQIPQTSLTEGPMNVVQGEFAIHGQRDWAALCSNGMVTEVRVVWGGPERCEDRLATRQDSDSIALATPTMANYTRRIDTVPPNRVQNYLLRFRSRLSETPEHDAIEETINGTGYAHYCAGGYWQSIP